MLTPAFWHDDSTLAKLLTPLSWLYAIGRKIHVLSASPCKPAIPTICIGNVTAGGAGKTPTVTAISAILKSAGHNPHIITRGHGGNITSPIMVDIKRHSATDVGDEALLHAENFPCWVARDRLEGIEAAARAGADIAIMDDGLQNPHIEPTISLLVVDGGYGIGNGRLLPAGPLREPLANVLKRIEASIIIGHDEHNIAMALDSVIVFKADVVATANSLSGKKIFAFAGIGRPEKFYNTLKSIGADLVRTKDFPDHFSYRTSDLQPIMDYCAAHSLTPVTTSKDYVKIPAIMRDKIIKLPVSLKFADEPVFKHWLLEMMK